MSMCSQIVSASSSSVLIPAVTTGSSSSSRTLAQQVQRLCSQALEVIRRGTRFVRTTTQKLGSSGLYRPHGGKQLLGRFHFKTTDGRSSLRTFPLDIREIVLCCRSLT